MREWILSSSVLILIIAAVRAVMRGKIGLRLQYALWLLALLRLLIPLSLGKSPVSVANFVPSDSVSEVNIIQVPPSLSTTEFHPVPDPASPAQAVGAEGGSPAPAAAPAAPDMKALARLVWLIGAGAVLLVSIASDLIFSLRLARGRVPADTACPLPVYTFPGIDSPCLMGLFRPAIYIPPQLMAQPKSLEHVLEHEQAHLRHGDHIWARLRCLALALHWYNPLVWLAAELSKRDGELACDEAAVARLGEAERFEYGRTLIALTCPGRSRLLSAATTMTGSRRSVKERVGLLAQRPRTAVITLLLVLTVALGAVGCTFTGGEDKSEPLPSPTAQPAGSATPQLADSAAPQPSPMRYTESFKSGDGMVDCTLDFELPDLSGLSMGEIGLSRHEFTPQELQTAAQLIFGDAPLLDISAYPAGGDYSKEDIDRYLSICKKLQEDQDLLGSFSHDLDISNEQLRNIIARYDRPEIYAAAPSDEELESVQWSAGLTAANSAESFLHAKASMNGEHYQFTVKDDHHDDGTVLHGIYASIDNGYLALVPHDYSCYLHSSPTEPTPQQLDAAQQDAARIMKGIGGEDWTISSCAAFQRLDGRYYISVDAARSYDGFTGFKGDRYSAYLIEYMHFEYGTDGTLINFSYMCPWEQKGAPAEKAPVLSAQEAVRLASDTLKGIDGSAVPQGAAYCEFLIDSVYPDYFIRQPEDGETDFRLVPAICFGGKYTIYNSQGTAVNWSNEGSTNMLALNAIDGSVINVISFR